MYNNFFGFRERPFKLTPDPAYLFLGKSHEEAIAHLIYAISQGEGFVEIIGEAGTGKTILCRALIERLEKEIEVAYIFNPKLDSLQLLKAVNDELGIASGADNVKDLIDTLNAFLLQKKAERKKVILLIDEAQNLAKDVIEQIRLLSNLETATDKLLQIILVGQPELSDMLDSHELRQLRQRITLSCYLKPLSRRETEAYIRHRINIASQKPGVKFSRAAAGAIFRYSQGIPRLINIASDRALLVAYGLNQPKIGNKAAAAAVRELRGASYHGRYGRRPQSRPAWIFLLLAVLFFFLIVHFKLFDRTGPIRWGSIAEYAPTYFRENQPPAKQPTQSESAPKQHPAAQAPSDAGTPRVLQEAPPAGPAAEPDSAPTTSADLERFLGRMDASWSRQAAVKTVLKLWGVEAALEEPPDGQPSGATRDDQKFFEAAAEKNGFSILSLKNDFRLVEKLDLPAILGCYTHDNRLPKYVVLSALDGGVATLLGGAEDYTIQTETGKLRSFCTASDHILWKNYRGLVDSGPAGLSEDSIVTLKMMLLDLGFNEIQISSDYDPQTAEAVKLIQEKRGLHVDGIVGPRTKIALYNEMNSYDIPHIRFREGTSAP